MLKGNVLEVWKAIISKYVVKKVFFNKDYEPYAISRDNAIVKILKSNAISTYTFKDQVIFEENDVLKEDRKPYTVYTPYKNKWLKLLESTNYSAKIHKKEDVEHFCKLETLAIIGIHWLRKK